MLLDFYTHHYAENPNSIEDEDDSFDLEEIMASMEDEADWETLIDTGRS